MSKRYGLSKSTLFKRSKRDDWDGQREQAVNAARTLSIERTAEAAADNATLAADIKRKMLLRLKRIESKYPMDATEVRTRQGNNTTIFKITDLTRAYKDLAEDIPKPETANEWNSVIMSYAELFSRAAPERAIDGLNAEDGEDSEDGEDDV